MEKAPFGVLFFVRYNSSPKDVAVLVVVSSLLSIIMLPLLLFWLIPK